MFTEIPISLVKGSPQNYKDAFQITADEGSESLVYEQHLKRSRGLFHVLFMSLSILSVPYSIAAPIATSLVGGGPAAMVWGWLLVTVFTVPVALSLAEISSKYPTSAGTYYWCFRLASGKSRVMLSWVSGWLGLIGTWTVCLSVTFGTAQLLVAIAQLYHPNWNATAWQTYLVFLAVTCVSSIPSLFLNHVLPIIDTFCACWTALGILVTLVCLPAKAAAGRRSISFALGHFDSSFSGWSPGWTFFVGLLPPAYCYAGIGIISCMAEEVHEPSSHVPQAIVWTVPIGGLAGVVSLLPIVFTLPDIPTLLAVPSGQPVAVIFELVMGSKEGALGMWFIVFGTGMFCAVSSLCIASRVTWAFARDGAIPFSRFFSRVSHDAVPVNAFLLSTGIQLLLGLLVLGSSAALNAFIGVAVMCLGASSITPVAISLANGRKDVADAPWALGRLGVPINVLAVAWVVFETVVFSIPAVIPVTKGSMNYASVVFVGFSALSAASYFFHGRHRYIGPPSSSINPD